MGSVDGGGFRFGLPGLVLIAALCSSVGWQAADPRISVAAARLKDAAAARKDGLWEEARGEYELAAALDANNAEAKAGVEALDAERVLVWSDALQKKYVDWRKKRDKAAKDDARKLEPALKAASGDEAAALARLMLRLDPEQKEARGVLGQAFVKDLGWVPQADAEQYGKGLRPWGKEWVPAKSVEGKAATWEQAQVFVGERFRITCNAGRKEGLATLGWAEDTYRAFRREFRGLLAFETPAEGMTIFHFKDRADLDEHNRTAHGDRPGLKQAPGFFSNEDRVGHFFPVAATETTLEEIVHHETTHQLAYYAMPAKGNPTAKPHFWAWEGLAAYFESLQNRDGKLVLGNPNQLRIRLCREAVAKGTHVPWREFVMGTQQNMSGRYPQAATMVHFLMNARNGAYREKLAAYLRVVHEASAQPDTFETCFGAKPEAMEAEWLAYVKALK